jgi:hypothetical protein
MQIKDRIFIVTGASSGIGLSTAIALSDPRRVRMNHVEARIVGPLAAGQLASLLASQPGCVWNGHPCNSSRKRTRGGPVAMGLEVSPTGSRSASQDNRSATRSAIAKTGAMLLNGQERASASKSAVAAARGLGRACHQPRRVITFLAPATPTNWRPSLLTGGLLVRIQPEEPILSGLFRSHG